MSFSLPTFSTQTDNASSPHDQPPQSQDTQERLSMPGCCIHARGRGKHLGRKCLHSLFQQYLPRPTAASSNMGWVQAGRLGKQNINVAPLRLLVFQHSQRAAAHTSKALKGCEAVFVEDICRQAGGKVSIRHCIKSLCSSTVSQRRRQGRPRSSLPQATWRAGLKGKKRPKQKTCTR